MDFLQQISEQRQADLTALEARVPLSQLQTQAQAFEAEYGPPINPIQQLRRDPKYIGIAAEFKRASPSKGIINADLDVIQQAQSYANAGASVISVLTEETQFKGTFDDLLHARTAVQSMASRPAILCKDFVLNEYQLTLARAYGADTILLIVAILTPERLTELIQKARELSMEPLVEVNNEQELDVALQANAKLIGVNNRNLHTLQLDLQTTIRISQKLRDLKISLDEDGITLIALSGVAVREDVEAFEKCGVTGVLVGETLMRSANPAETIKELIGAKRLHRNTLVKICGITDANAATHAVQKGTNMVGMIFAESPRRVEIEQAKEIVAAVRAFGERSDVADLRTGLEMPANYNTSTWFQHWANRIYAISAKTPLVVGVFMDQSVDEINRIAEEVGLDMVQLHGDEGFAICDQIIRPVTRVVHLPSYSEEEAVDPSTIIDRIEPGHAAMILLDTTVKGQRGGTGTTFDWGIAALFQQKKVPCILAGGLNASNVNKSIHIGQPFGVDVSSGVEISAGVKDLDQIEAFIKATKENTTTALPAFNEEDEEGM